MSTDFLVYFLDEAADILAGWEKSCLEMEQSDSHEAVESLYRGAHNLKSGGASVGLLELSQFVHHIEDLISKFLAGKIQKTPDLVKLFLDAHTILTMWFNQLRQDPKYVPNAERLKVDQDIINLSGGVGGEAAIEVPVEAAPEATLQATLEATPEPVHVEKNPEPKHASVARQAESVRVAANKLDMLIQLVGELSTQQAIVWHARQNGALGSKSSDNAIQLIQKNAKELQGLALSLRMQSLESLFQRLERTARDLARNQGKKLDVVANGSHVELDRAVIERITEALTHVIRNAVDHGVEDPVSRFGEGKTMNATLRLSGSQEPGGVLITIADDGRGLNLDRILKKAIEKGLADPNEKYTNAEIQRFIFSHGFSTAEKITDVSGRGVGMDVVKNAVQGIGGSITVNSTAGKGTLFSIALPATLSIVDALIVEANGCRYAVPVQDVSEIIDLSSLKVERVGTHGQVLSLRNSVVQVERLQDHLPPQNAHRGSSQRGGTSETQSSSIRPALLIRTGAGVIAFQIDRITGQQPVSLRPLPGGLDKIPGYTGGSILGDGDACIILNLPFLVRRHIEQLSSASGGGTATDTELQETDLAEDNESQTLESRHLIFSLHGRVLAVPLALVREILATAIFIPQLRAPEHIAGCIEVRGSLLTVVNLASVLGLVGDQDRGGPMIVIEVEHSTFAFRVDKVEAVADIALIPSPVGTASSGDFAFVAAAAHFGDKLISIIDMQGVLRGTAGLTSADTQHSIDVTGAEMEAS